jgi:hypothetical protein
MPDTAPAPASPTVRHLRQVLDAQLRPGKGRSSGHAKAALGRLLDKLGERGPALVRGDCGCGYQSRKARCGAVTQTL